MLTGAQCRHHSTHNRMFFFALIYVFVCIEDAAVCDVRADRRALDSKFDDDDGKNNIGDFLVKYSPFFRSRKSPDYRRNSNHLFQFGDELSWLAFESLFPVRHLSRIVAYV